MTDWMKIDDDVFLDSPSISSAIAHRIYTNSLVLDEKKSLSYSHVWQQDPDTRPVFSSGSLFEVGIPFWIPPIKTNFPSEIVIEVWLAGVASGTINACLQVGNLRSSFVAVGFQTALSITISGGDIALLNNELGTTGMIMFQSEGVIIANTACEYVVNSYGKNPTVVMATGAVWPVAYVAPCKTHLEYRGDFIRCIGRVESPTGVRYPVFRMPQVGAGFDPEPPRTSSKYNGDLYEMGHFTISSYAVNVRVNHLSAIPSVFGDNIPLQVIAARGLISLAREQAKIRRNRKQIFSVGPATSRIDVTSLGVQWFREHAISAKIKDVVSGKITLAKTHFVITEQMVGVFMIVCCFASYAFNGVIKWTSEIRIDGDPWFEENERAGYYMLTDDFLSRQTYAPTNVGTADLIGKQGANQMTTHVMFRRLPTTSVVGNTCEVTGTIEKTSSDGSLRIFQILFALATEDPSYINE